MLLIRRLYDAGKAKRVDFCGDFKPFLEDNPAVSQSIWFSDEAHFHLNGYVNKQNMHVWANEHLHNIMKIPLCRQKCIVCSALSRSGTTGPILLMIL